MFSLDRVTQGIDGYREPFQSGETLNGRPLIDQQKCGIRDRSSSEYEGWPNP